MDITLPQLLNEKETSRMLAVSVAALRRWRREHRGPRFVKLQRAVRYSVSELSQFLERNSSWHEKAADSRSAAQREVRRANATAQG